MSELGIGPCYARDITYDHPHVIIFENPADDDSIGLDRRRSTIKRKPAASRVRFTHESPCYPLILNRNVLVFNSYLPTYQPTKYSNAKMLKSILLFVAAAATLCSASPVADGERQAMDSMPATNGT